MGRVGQKVYPACQGRSAQPAASTSGHQILEEKLLDLLIPRPELQTLLASFVEFIQKIPELQKKHGHKNDFSRMTIRDELKILLYDIATGVFDRFREIRGQQRLERVTINDANNCSHVFIKRITDEYNLR